MKLFYGKWTKDEFKSQKKKKRTLNTNFKSIIQVLKNNVCSKIVEGKIFSPKLGKLCAQIYFK